MFGCKLGWLVRGCFGDPGWWREGSVVCFTEAEEGEGQLGVGGDTLEESAVPRWLVGERHRHHGFG